LLSCGLALQLETLNKVLKEYPLSNPGRARPPNSRLVETQELPSKEPRPTPRRYRI
jgi:hypothetical protein